jgi:hypothetical protein
MIIKTWLNQNSPATVHLKYIEIVVNYWYKYAQLNVLGLPAYYMVVKNDEDTLRQQRPMGMVFMKSSLFTVSL